MTLAIIILSYLLWVNDLSLIFLNAASNIKTAHVRDMLSPKWIRTLIFLYKTSHKLLLTNLVSAHRTLFAGIDFKFTFHLLEQDRTNETIAALLKSLEAHKLPPENLNDNFLRDNICTNIKTGNELGEILIFLSPDKWAVILKALKLTPHSENDNIDFSWLEEKINLTLPRKLAAYELYRSSGRKALTSFMNMIGLDGGYPDLFDALHEIDTKLKACREVAPPKALFDEVKNAIITHFEKEFERMKADAHGYSPSASTKAIAIN